MISERHLSTSSNCSSISSSQSPSRIIPSMLPIHHQRRHIPSYCMISERHLSTSSNCSSISSSQSPSRIIPSMLPIHHQRRHIPSYCMISERHLSTSSNCSSISSSQSPSRIIPSMLPNSPSEKDLRHPDIHYVDDGAHWYRASAVLLRFHR